MNDISEEFQAFLTLCDNVHDHQGQELRKTYVMGFAPWFERYENGDFDLEKNLGGMAKNGINEEEAFMLLAYTGSHSSWVNSDLRNGQITNCECKSEFISRLNKTLDKIISFNNQIVYRMDNPSENKEVVLKWFNSKIGFVFRIPYFLSTAKEDYENTEIVWKIMTLPDNSLGKDISDITNNEFELEVLFKTGSCFKIESVDYDKSYINLIEVPSSCTIDFELTRCPSDNIK